MKISKDILVCGVNWLGDACMTMPALQVFKKKHSDCCITMLTKPALKPLWEIYPSVDNIITLESSFAGMLRTARKIRSHKFQSAYILPNSWRSALIPLMAHIPNRIGQTGHHRQILLTSRTQLQTTKGHQQWEYVDILKLENIKQMPYPVLLVPEESKIVLEKKLQVEPKTKLIGILPGAARGPSKQWPQEHYISAAKIIAKNCKCSFVIMGTKNEAELCNSVCNGIGNHAISLAGKTTLSELVAALDLCSTVLCNDSGGMHLAASAGTPVVAIYGITDSSRTGPLGSGHHIIQAENVKVSREISRDSQEARDALKSISPDKVAQAALSVLHEQKD